MAWGVGKQLFELLIQGVDGADQQKTTVPSYHCRPVRMPFD
jgi:hypothetical protein